MPVRDNEAVLQLISIHALHEESDDVLRLSTINSIISIHALHEESEWTTLQPNDAS